jgi:hypothetical protein
MLAITDTRGQSLICCVHCGICSRTMSNLCGRLLVLLVALLGAQGVTAFSIKQMFSGSSDPYTPSPKPVNSKKNDQSEARSARKAKTPVVPPFQMPPEPPHPAFEMPHVDFPEMQFDEFNPITPSAWNEFASGLLNFASKFAPRDTSNLSDKAGRITLNRLPPQSYKFDFSDIPIIGSSLSGTFAKVDDSKVKTPSIIIAAPRDKATALQHHFGVNSILHPVFDIILEPNQPGVAPFEFRSSLIPQFSFGEGRSDWNKVINMGDGSIYYFNSKTQESQLTRPPLSSSGSPRYY